MQIPDVTKKQVLEMLRSSLEETYKQQLLSKTKTPFDQLCESILQEIWEDMTYVDRVTPSILKPYKNRRDMLKTRWAKKELNYDEKSALYNEVENVAKDIYHKANECGDVGIFSQLFGCADCEALKKKHTENLTNWEKQDASPLISFPFMKWKTVSQMKRALTNDVRYLTVKYLKENSPKHAVISVPDVLTHDFPLDISNRMKFPQTEIVQKDGTDYFLNRLEINPDLTFESYLQVEFTKKDKMQDFVKLLNATDWAVLQYVLSMKGDNFVLDGEILVDITDILLHCGAFQSDNARNYRAVKASLYKLRFTENGVINNDLHGFTFTLFSDVEIFKNGRREMAKITVSRNIINAYIEQRTIQMYKHTIESFEEKASKVIIFALQRKRILLSSSFKEKEPIVFQTTIRFFESIILFPNARVRERIKLVEKCLKDIIKSGITLKDYKVVGETFTLTFHPFSDDEKADLLYNKDILLAPME